MEDILQFKKIEEKDKDAVGLKAYNLSSIREYSNVPNGFVLSKNIMRKFLEENNIVEMIERFLSSLMIDNENIIPIVNLIQKRIINSKFSKELKEEILEFYESLAYSKSQDANGILNKKKESLVSVRNGEWTENSDNIYQLNVIGNEKLLEAIKLGFASNFTSKKIIIKKESGKNNAEIFESSINSVIIQSMQQVQRSGISISLNPENNSEKELVVRGAFGLGIAKDDPNLEYDEYIMDLDYEIINSKIGNQQYAYEKDIDSDITVKYMLKENSTKEKLNSSHLKEIGKVTRKLARILESNIILEWGFNKDKLIIFDAKPIELEKLNHDINEYSQEDKSDEIIEQENVELEEYEIPGDEVIEEGSSSKIDVIDSIEFPEEENIETINFEEESSSETDVFEEEGTEVVDLEEELEKPTLNYEEKVEEVVTLDDFEEEKESDKSEESDFGYNFLDERAEEADEVEDFRALEMKSSSESEEDIIIDLDENVNKSQEGPEPDLFINMNRPNLDEAAKRISEIVEENSEEETLERSEDDDFAQQLLDEDFEDLDDEDVFSEQDTDASEEIELFNVKEENQEMQQDELQDIMEEEISSKTDVIEEEMSSKTDVIEEQTESFTQPESLDIQEEKEEPSFFDMVEEDTENIFNQPDINIEEVQEPEFIAPIEEKIEEGNDFFSRMEVEEDGDFIFSNDNKEEIQPAQEPKVEVQNEIIEDSSKIIACDAQILKKLKEKFSEVFDHEPSNNFIQVIEQLKDKIEVPYEDEIKRVRMLREKYLSDYEDLSKEEIMFCINTSKNFINGF